MCWYILVLEYLKVLIWPIVVLVIIITYKSSIKKLFNEKLIKAKLPGGYEFTFKHDLNKAKGLIPEIERERPEDKAIYNLDAIVKFPKNTINKRMLQLNFDLSPSGLDFKRYEKLAAQDTNLALAGIRIELEILLNNFANRYLKNKNIYLMGKLKRLTEDGYLTNHQYELSKHIFNLCSKAVHGEIISYEDAIDIITLSKTLIEDYVSWLSWGFDDNWNPEE